MASKTTKTVHESISSSSSSAGANGSMSYQPVSRRAGSGYSSKVSMGGMGMGGGGGSISRTTMVSYGTKAGGGSMGNVGAIAESGVKTILSSRVEEKKDMQDLNMRFATYIEKNRFLEAQLKSCEQKLKDLQSKWGQETANVKNMFTTEIKNVRELYQESEKEKARIELRIQGLEDQCADYRRKIEDAERLRQQDRDTINRQNQQLSDYESELNLLRRKTAGLESDLSHEMEERKRIQEELFKTIQERDIERLNNIDLENRIQTLVEEIEFLKQLHEQELKEMAALATQDSYAQNRKYWEGEMSQAIRELQQEFDRRVDHHNSQLESYYKMKVQEVRTGQAQTGNKIEHLTTQVKNMQGTITDLRGQISDLENRNQSLERQYNDLLRQHEEDLRNWDEEKNRYDGDISRLTLECEKLIREMEAIMDSKLSLELEIAAYRKLLEGEENRFDMAQQMTSEFQVQSGSSAAFAAATKQIAGGGSGGGMGGGAGGGAGGDMSSSYNYSFSSASSTEQSSSSGTGGGAGGAAGSLIASQKVMTGEMSQKTTFQRSAKGPIAVTAVCPTGSWIEIENTGRKEESLGGWKVARKVDGKNVPHFSFPDTFTLGTTRDNRTVKVFAKGKGPAGCLEYEKDTFGTGQAITTSLLSPAGETRAEHNQKTVYAQ